MYVNRDPSGCCASTKIKTSKKSINTFINKKLFGKKTPPHITLHFLSFIPALPKGLEHNFLKWVKIFLLHLADFEPGSMCLRRDMSLYDLNNASLGLHAPVQGEHRGLGCGTKVWLSQPGSTAANTETLACSKGCGTQQTRTGLQKHVCRQGLVHPASSARQSSGAKHEAMLTGCQGRLCIISTIHFLSWTSA